MLVVVPCNGVSKRMSLLEMDGNDQLLGCSLVSRVLVCVSVLACKSAGFSA